MIVRYIGYIHHLGILAIFVFIINYQVLWPVDFMGVKAPTKRAAPITKIIIPADIRKTPFVKPLSIISPQISGPTIAP